jgi:hypothetical protein
MWGGSPLGEVTNCFCCSQNAASRRQHNLGEPARTAKGHGDLHDSFFLRTDRVGCPIKARTGLFGDKIERCALRTSPCLTFTPDLGVTPSLGVRVLAVGRLGLGLLGLGLLGFGLLEDRAQRRPHVGELRLPVMETGALQRACASPRSEASSVS